MSSTAFSQDDIKIADSLAAQGIAYYKKGNIADAINYFSRALLLDPHNNIAQKNLARLSSQVNINTKQKVNLLLFEDLLDHIKDLKKKINYYELKRNSLEKDLTFLEYNKKILNEEMLTIKNHIVNTKELTPNEEKVQYSNQENPLEIVNIWLKFEKEQLFSKILYLQKQCARLREISKEFAQSKLNEGKAKAHIQTKTVVRMPKPETIIAVDSENNTTSLDYVTNASDFIDEQQREIKDFQAELISVNSHVNKLENNISEKDERAEDLSDQIVDYALKLTEKENILSDKVKNLVALNEELSDLQARLDLGQRIIAEKDKTISDLQYKIDKLDPDNAETINETIDDDANISLANDKKLIELNDTLEGYRQKLRDTEEIIAENNNSLDSLTDKLVNLQEQVENGRRTIIIGKRTITAKDKQISALKRTIDSLRAKKDTGRETLKIIISEKDDQLNELNNILGVYRAKLSEANNTLKTKDANTTTLEEQLILVQTKLFDKDKHLQIANEQLSSLGEQILEMQSKLEKLTSSASDDETNNPLVADEIKTLKKKLQDINIFLQKDIQKTNNPQ